MFLRKFLPLGVGLSGIGLGYNKLTKNKDKLHIVFDLDHTLIHSLDMEQCAKGKQYENMTDSKPDFNIDCGYEVRLRRWTYPTLKILNKFATIHVFTMGTDYYAKQVIDKIDPHKKYFDVVLDRGYCKNMGDRNYCKDLRLIAKEKNLSDSHINKFILIDDKRRSFALDKENNVNQEPNGIQIRPFDSTIGQDNILIKVVAVIIWRMLLDSNDITNKDESRTVIK